jgi:hypothetical protein
LTSNNNQTLNNNLINEKNLSRPENSDNQFNFNGVKDGKSIPDDNGSKVDKKRF